MRPIESSRLRSDDRHQSVERVKEDEQLSQFAGASDLAPKFDPLGMLETKGFHGGLAPREKFANSTGVRSPRAL
jgi:hypothetical protein